MRLLIADDHPIIRDGIRSLVEARCPEHEVIAEVEDGVAAVEACEKLRPDIIVMDLGMPLLDGAGATRRILALDPAPRVIAISGRADADNVRAMLAAGALAFVDKADVSRDIVDAIDAVSRGRTYLSSRVARLVVGLATQPESHISKLSPREREVLARIAQGEATKEIAAHLGVSVKTVETQRKQLMGKLGTFTVAGLTKLAIREGLIRP